MDDKQVMGLKRTLRRRMKNLRRALDPQRRKRMSETIERSVRKLPEWKACKHLCTFVGSKPGEVDTLGIISAALDNGKKICVPVVDPNSLELSLAPLAGPGALAPGHFGILEPLDAPRFAPDKPDWDLVLVPGLAFGRDGSRLGFGRGYYDRLLSARNSFRVALAFSFQILDSVPVLPRDVPVDLIVTENEIIPTG